MVSTWSTCTMIMWIPTCDTWISANYWQQLLTAKVWISGDRQKQDDTKKNLTILQCRGAISRYRYINVGRTPSWANAWLRTKIYANVRRLWGRLKKRPSRYVKNIAPWRSKKILWPRIILNRSSSRKTVDNFSMHAIKDEPRDDDVSVEMSFAQKDMILIKWRRNEKIPR